MDLNHGSLHSLFTYPDAPTYPPLEEDLTCEVLVLGGGEAGSLAAYYLTEAGVDTVLVDKRRVGHGSTCANTGLLQYANDASLFQLANSVGEAPAVRFYNLCLQAIHELEAIASGLDDPTDFERRNSLYYASSQADVKKLEAEYEIQRKHGFPVEYWTEGQIAERFPFRKPAALYAGGDAQINPFKLAHAVNRKSVSRGLRLFEETEVTSIFQEAGWVHFRTQRGFMIRAKKAVFATGYETQEVQHTKGAVLGGSYAIATEPLPAFPTYENRELIWETARPYLYIRTTADHRILVGGLDETAIQGAKRDNPLPQKAEQLLQELKKLFPAFADAKIAFQWSATFGNTKDGMPFVGEHPFYENCYTSLGYGGNGTVYATLAGQMLRDLVTKGSHPDAPIFSPARFR